MATFILLIYLSSDKEEQVHHQPDSGILLSAQADSSCWGSLTTGQSERRFSCPGERQHFTAVNGRPAALSTCTCGYEAWVRVSGVFVPLCLMWHQGNEQLNAPPNPRAVGCHSRIICQTEENPWTLCQGWSSTGAASRASHFIFKVTFLIFPLSPFYFVHTCWCSCLLWLYFSLQDAGRYHSLAILGMSLPHF